MNHIKINLPTSWEGYENGYGEGCWALCDNEVKKAYDTNEDGTSYECLLDNDSDEYPYLFHGTTVPIEMRGRNRPVVPYNWLYKNYGEPVSLREGGE